MNRRRTIWTVMALSSFLSAADLHSAFSADAPAKIRAAPPARLTPDLIKQYDKNGDGALDQTERAAARAERARSRRDEIAWRPETAPRASGASKTSSGQTPLTEMSAEDRVRGQDGGLYGQGRNNPPEALRKAAQAELARIVPLDHAGTPSPDGKIVLLSIGMSNTTREFTAFKQRADADPRKAPQLVIVDGAQGGQGAAEWCEPNSKKTWARAEQRLRTSGVTTNQVQVVWIKQAIKRPTPDSMESAKELHVHLATIVRRARELFPNLRIAYLSSRTYGGFSERHGEPDSFDTAFAVRWVIQDQLAGKLDLNYEPALGPVKAPLLLWGPYLWADGDVPRKSDGLAWLRQDFVADGTHPSPAGQRKVVDQLLKFFTTDPLATSWFVK